MSGKLLQFSAGKAAIGTAHPKNLEGAAKVWDYARRFATA
jgi:hypothetical protein